MVVAPGGQVGTLLSLSSCITFLILCHTKETTAFLPRVGSRSHDVQRCRDSFLVLLFKSLTMSVLHAFKVDFSELSPYELNAARAA